MTEKIYENIGVDSAVQDQLRQEGAIPPAPASSKDVGKVKRKKKLMVYGGLAIFFAGLVGSFAFWVMHNQQRTAPVESQPIQQTSEPKEVAALVAGAGTESAQTVMSGDGVSAPQAAVPASLPEQTADKGVPASASHGSASGQVGAQSTASTLAPASATASSAVASAASTAAKVASASAMSASATSVPIASVAASNKELEARVAQLESDIKRIEAQRSADRPHTEVNAKAFQPKVRKSAVAKTGASAPAGHAAEAEKQAPAKQEAVRAANDTVHILGVTTRQGVTTVLIEFAGVTQRKAVGESVSGLGVISSIGIDAAGVPVVEINGVKYQ